VLAHVVEQLKAHTSTIAGETVTYDVTAVFDPLEVFAAGGALYDSGAQLTKPIFMTKPAEIPAAMTAMGEVIKAADAYLIVTPEYNHSLPPALTSMMGHFGGSSYANKPRYCHCHCHCHA
jgi:NAD(P)H-dependent FMN reductase